MDEFWESSFKDKQEMWGMTPTETAYRALNLFEKKGVKNILIPGFGYGRNAVPFLNRGIEVTGIEISQTAIHLAQERLGDRARVHHGSVNSMPFDEELYDGIFCYALLHLLSKSERLKFIESCYKQLNANGYMVFVTLSKKDGRYNVGDEIARDTFKSKHGVELFFYDLNSIYADFGQYGLVDAKEVFEPEINLNGKPSQCFWFLFCKKGCL